MVGALDPVKNHDPISSWFSLESKVCIITGASRGIGASCARVFFHAGARLVVAARTHGDLEALAREIDPGGSGITTVPCDVSDFDQVKQLAQVALENYGQIDILINNAGGALPRSFLDTSPRYLEEAFHFNVASAHALNRACVPVMLESGGGAIVNISSVMGRVSGRGYLGYGTAKAALAHYTKLAARDLAPKIRVNAIAVGSVATSALDIVMADDHMKGAMEEATPLKRIGHPDEVAIGALYLASAAGGYITGKVLEIDGGLEAPNLDLGLEDL